MQAIGIERLGGSDEMRELALDPPEPGRDEVLVGLRAAGVGPWDYKLRESGAGPGTGFPFVMGAEGAGVVTAVGEAVTGFSVGDEVYVDRYPSGCWAESVAASVGVTARKPTTLSFEQAAAVPVAGITAHTGIVDELAVRSGETLLITGAAGGVGTFAVQLAASAGARVIAQVAERDADYVMGLGATAWVDRADDGWVAAARDTAGGSVDALLDLVGGDTFLRGCDAVREGGRAATPVAFDVVDQAPDGIRATAYGGVPDGARLARLAGLIDEGHLEVHVADVRPLSEARDALDALQNGHVRGKLVLRISD